jgi:hypothetical protein
MPELKWNVRGHGTKSPYGDRISEGRIFERIHRNHAAMRRPVETEIVVGKPQRFLQTYHHAQQ